MYRTACGGVKLTMQVKTTVSALCLAVILSSLQIITWMSAVQRVEELFWTARDLRNWTWRFRMMGWMFSVSVATLVCAFYTKELIQSQIPGGICADKPTGLWEFVLGLMAPKEQVCGLVWIVPRATCSAILVYMASNVVFSFFFL